VVGTLVGIGLQEGLIQSVEQKLIDILPEYFGEGADSRARAIRLRHLLTQTSGFDFDFRSEGAVGWRIRDPRRVLNGALASAPGKAFSYDDCNPQLLIHALSKVSRSEFYDFASTNLFTPLGIGDRRWGTDGNKIPNGSFGLWLSTNDLVKIVSLYMVGGKLNGLQLIPQTYCEEAVSPQCGGGYPGDEKYGYLMWSSIESGHRAFFGLGYGGVVAMGVPELDLVVALMADESSGLDKINYPRKIISKVIIPAFRK
jgi:CubicO group peptidase (beta-lactamase class C family)